MYARVNVHLLNVGVGGQLAGVGSVLFCCWVGSRDWVQIVRWEAPPSAESAHTGPDLGPPNEAVGCTEMFKGLVFSLSCLSSLLSFSYFSLPFPFQLPPPFPSSHHSPFPY